MALWALPSTAGAAPSILLESYPGDRPNDAGRYIEIMVRSLGDKTPQHGEALRKRVEAELSLPAGPARESKGMRALVNDGRRQFIEGNYKRAITRLEKARDMLLSSTRVVAADQSLRKSLHRSLMFLAHAYLRSKKGQKATQRMGEVIRGFPDQELSLVEYGPELVKFYKKVRRQMRRQNRGALTVSTSAKGCNVFVNQRFVGTSPVRVPDLYPGRYWVYVQRLGEHGRVHTVKMSGGDYKLRVNFGLDSALVTRPWTGLRFDSPGTLKTLEYPYAASVGRTLGAPSVLVAGIREHKGVRSLVGTLVSTATGKMVRFATVALEPAAPSDGHVAALGQFLVAGQIDAHKTPLKNVFPPTVIKDEDEEEKRKREEEKRKREEEEGKRALEDHDPLDVRRSPMGVIKWVALGVSVAALAGGITLLAMDGSKVSCGLPEDVLCPERYATVTPGAILTAAGGSAVVAAGILFFIDHRRTKKSDIGSVVVPWVARGGGGITAILSF